VTPRDWAIIGLLVLTAVMVVRWHLMSVNMGLGKPIFRSQRRAQKLSRLEREGYHLDYEGKTTCSSCHNYCGQCGDTSRHGLTLTEYEEKFWGGPEAAAPTTPPPPKPER